MANVLTRNPLKIDTADAATALIASSARLRVRKIMWDAEGAVAGNNAVVQDADGNPVWQDVAAAASHHREADFAGGAGVVAGRGGFDINGLKVPTLDSGTLLIFLA